VRDARELRVGGIEQDIVFEALGDKRRNHENSGACFGKPAVAEGAADGLVGGIPTGKIGGGKSRSTARSSGISMVRTACV
jgi:hypothetical protein